MNIDTLLTIAAAIGVGGGGFLGGRMTGKYNSHQIATQTVEMLQAQVDLLERNKEERELDILDLTQRVAVLEGLVTQRAAVEEVHEDVKANQAILRRIADKVEA